MLSTDLPTERPAMKFIMTKWLPLLALVLLLGGIGYVAVVDVPVSQTSIEKTIPNNRFFQ